MRLSFVTVFFLFIFTLAAATVFARNDSLFIQKIGFHCTLPTGFNLIDSQSRTLSPIPEIHVWQQKYIYTAAPGFLSFGITRSQQKNIDWSFVFNREAEHFYKTMQAQKPDFRLNLLLSFVVIGSKKFDKYLVTGKNEQGAVYNNIQISTMIHDYRFSISYNYTTPEQQVLIEAALATAKFDEETGY